MSEFTNLTLLECSRNQSNQFESNDNSNHSIWTNRMGKTISLDVGDTIEVKSAYINQRGCANPNSIEFKGEDLGVEIELEETTEVVPDVYTYEQFIYPWNDLSVPGGLNNFQQGNLGFRFRNNQIVKKRLKDNVLYLEQNYYKNANGEETIMLPRSYNRIRNDEVIDTNGATPPVDPFNNIRSSVSRYWTYSDVDYDYDQSINLVNFGINTGYPTLKVQNTRNTNPLGDPTNSSLIPIFNTHDYECKFIQGDYYPTTKIEAPPTPPAEYTRSNFWMMKQRNDNSRFTLFEREFDFTIWSLYGGDNPAVKDNDTYNPKYEIKNKNGDVVYNLSSYRWFKNDASIPSYDPLDTQVNFPPGYKRIEGTQPAICRYVKVSDVIEINIKKGFNSPEDVATQITQTLQQQKKNSPITYQKPEAVGNSDGGVFQDTFSVGIETPTYKPVITTTYSDFNSQRTYGTDPSKTSNFVAYMEEGVSEEKYNGEGAFEWWRTHHNIYVKRPDLFIAGRKLNNRYNRIWHPDIATAPPTPPDADLDLLQHGAPNYILNDIPYDEHEINNTTDKIITSLIWNKTNLDRLKNLMDIQGQYPELFSGIDDTIQNNQYLTNIERFNDAQGEQVRYKPFATINNSRFLHLNRFDDHNPAEATGWGDNFITLGDDDYRAFTYTKTIDGQQRDFGITHMSMPVFFYFDIERRNKLTSGEDENDLCYGCFSKSIGRIGGVSAPIGVITIHPEKLNGIRKEAFELRGGKTNNTTEWNAKGITAGTCQIGWDWHFNSYGNLVMLKDIATPKFDQGSNNKTDSWIEMDKKFLVGTGGQTYNFEKPLQINLSYLGTNNIACRYNSNNKNFFFEYLHTPERIQNDWNSGLPTTTGTTADKDLVSSEVSIVDGQGNEVYKINKRLEGWTFCPDMCPYLNNDVFQLGSTADDPKLQINSFSQLIPWVIYDSHMGINLNFGKSALLPPDDESGKNQLQVWNNSVLGIMGFSFEQFNPTKVLFSENGAQARVRYDNNNSLYNPTTNCQVVNTDANQFVVSPWGAVRYGTQLPYQIILKGIEYTRWGETKVPCDSPYMPSISQSTQSIQITGVNLPRVVLKPFYNIRTDVLSQDRYVGGINSGLAFPIIASVNRINADKDFVQLDGGSEVFTITTPIKFSSITTAITDSDGKFGELDNGSVVVYKITKMDNLQNYDILAQIQQKLKK